jgi:hypothetical protein
MDENGTRQSEHLARTRSVSHRNLNKGTILTQFDSSCDQRHSLHDVSAPANCLHNGFNLEEGEVPRDDPPYHPVFKTPSMALPSPQQAGNINRITWRNNIYVGEPERSLPLEIKFFHRDAAIEKRRNLEMSR